MKCVILVFQENTDVIGAKHVHAYARSRGHDCRLLLVPKSDPQTVNAVLGFLQTHQPEVAGFSTMSHDAARVAELAQRVRKLLPLKATVIGGIHATSAPDNCLEYCDIVVRGEGEETFVELLDALSNTPIDKLDHITGIAFRRSGENIFTPVRPLNDHLDALPPPGHLPDEMYVAHGARILPVTHPNIIRHYVRYHGTFLSAMSSRGCPYHCDYCCNSIFHELYGRNRIRRRGPDNVVAEIVNEVRAFPNILYVNFLDDCFMAQPKPWLERFAELYTRDVGIPFLARSTPINLTREKLTLLRKAGLRWAIVGLQTGSDITNKEIYGRSFTAQDFVEGARLLAELKINPWYDVILDNPYEPEEEQVKTVETLLSIPRPFQIEIASLAFLPGTPLYKKAHEDGIPVPELTHQTFRTHGSTPVNRLVRMTPSLPRALVRMLLSRRNARMGRLVIYAFYYLALVIEPFVYMLLIHRSNDYRLQRTWRVFCAFYVTAIRKLLLRHEV